MNNTHEQCYAAAKDALLVLGIGIGVPRAAGWRGARLASDKSNRENGSIVRAKDNSTV